MSLQKLAHHDLPWFSNWKNMAAVPGNLFNFLLFSLPESVHQIQNNWPCNCTIMLYFIPTILSQNHYSWVWQIITQAPLPSFFSRVFNLTFFIIVKINLTVFICAWHDNWANLSSDKDLEMWLKALKKLICEPWFIFFLIWQVGFQFHKIILTEDPLPRFLQSFQLLLLDFSGLFSRSRTNFST